MTDQETDLEIKFYKILDGRIKEASISGKFILEENVLNSWNLGAEINKVWHVDHPCEVHEIEDNLYFFVFLTVVDKWRVLLSNKTWLINGKLLVVREWPDKLEDMEDLRFMDFKTQDFWVHIYGTEVPMEFVFDILEQGELFDDVVAVDDHPYTLLYRFKVSVFLNRALPRGFILRSRDGTSVVFKYESLPDLCRCCGLFGHDPEVCWVVEDRSLKIYGDWIRGELQEPLEAIIQGQWDGTYQFPDKRGYNPLIEEMEFALKGRCSFMPYFNHVKKYDSLKAAEERGRSEKAKSTRRIKHNHGKILVIQRQ